MVPSTGPFEWASTPFTMIATPKHVQNLSDTKTDEYVEAASSMAVFHNLLLRSLNTIYLQAPHVKDGDKKAFVGYAYCWYDAIDAHHTGEEQEFFPWIEEAAGEKGIMDANVEQHKIFEKGIKEYGSYLRSLKGKEKTFSGDHMRSIINSFGPPLHQHLSDEIPSLLALRKYGDKIHLNELWDKQSIGKFTLHSAATRIPFYLCNLDRTFEDGLWKDFPEVPKLAKDFMGNWVARLNGGYWKFGACTMTGVPKELYAKGK
ncbi:hypothetical protein LTR84_011624 [Exophiala bonariae]|uniref:Hemerythrin-like domain-containing protein n=1 Tax=Exophiala bonariae TaxID=1690606 RepID=A0AAV9NK55_9EURO|nr:hypothetical protein LTR84_011624 [Exophiala bonariae]